MHHLAGILTWFAVALFALVIGSAPLHAQETVFSGPQAGEKLPDFQVRGVFDEDAGKLIDFVAEAKGQPILLIFVHEMTRPAISFTRALSAYTLSRAKDGLVTGIVWLDADATAAENAVKRVQHALTPGARVGVSMDGQEGPGSYGLNRKVALTIIIAKQNKVTANFALVQPSLQADLPKVLEKIVEVVGGKVPKLSEIPGVAADGAMRARPEEDSRLRELLRRLIRRDATDEDAAQAARDIEQHLAAHPPAKAELGRIASTIVASGKIANYGTKPAQESLRKWAEKFGPTGATADRDKPQPQSDGGKPR